MSYGIVLVTFNRLDFLKKALERIKIQTVIPSLLVVVDNFSQDGTDEYLKSFATTFPSKILRTSSNIGHGAALAVGMEYITSVPQIDYLLLLEDDSLPDPKLAETMLELMEKWVYKILCLDGYQIGIGKRTRPLLSHSTPTEVDYALLDGVVMSAEILRVVGFPKHDFFMMCDDFEYSKRIRKHGYKIGCIKTELHQILHLGGGQRFSRSTLWRGYYQARNNVHILKEYFSLIELLDFLLLESKRILGCLMAQDRFYRIYLRLLGIYHGLLGRKGKTLDPSQF